jgi:hypothetical protein
MTPSPRRGTSLTKRSGRLCWKSPGPTTAFYQDPTGTADGWAALVAHIGGVHAMSPCRSIDFASGIEATEAGVRWAWGGAQR